ncbi:MAG: alpha-N-arabinofuranosidase [Bacteroidaceae bacterium]|nr:alpha-N-arabinofuranosidase [Bacteroidaceae bacterium]
MKKHFKSFAVLSLLAFSTSTSAQLTSEISLDVTQEGNVIPKEIYGQFSEHLGQCIYGGLWVGENSQIPNEKGYRKDVLQALKDLHVPVLRWPGGCFADEYHWMDGIGPKEKRPTMVNNNWGGTVEDNSFGTHEFLNLCEMLGCEPYISGNVGSGTVEEMAKWVEYMTSDGNSPMANLRRENGREKPWKVKFLGVGNESWGCGGNMRPEYYSDLYRRYSTYCREYDGNKLYKVASGASDYDYNWTRVCMKAIGNKMNAISLHYYSVINGWDVPKGSATDFTTAEYLRTLSKCREVEEVLQKHIAIMDELDPKNRVDLLLDEWGTWWDVEEGTNPGWLFQQNTMRDALVASLSFDIFHKYTRRLKMANIAQIVNVLQSMILTDQEGTGHMVLTPTYHVFRMYNVHQDATYLPLEVKCDVVDTDGNRKLPLVSATASKKNGQVHLSVTNASPDKTETITVNINGLTIKNAEGEILQGKEMGSYNSFQKPEEVKPAPFKGAKVKKGVLTLTLPAHSIVTLTLK